MCGITGIISDELDQVANVANMLKAIDHRGPDGQDIHQDVTRKCTLGHKRLAIIDIEGGKQPLPSEDQTIWITFNGCIYNYLELGAILRQKGHRFRTYSDTEVILHAYEEYGEECVHKLIGMFAFAIWDGTKQRLFCARDRLGVKPFYYWQQRNSFIFASEIKALLATDIVSRNVDREALQEYLTFQAPVSANTLFAGINKLLPGHRMTVDNNGRVLSLDKYWDISFEPDVEHTEEYFVDHLRLLLKDAVKIRLRSDVPLGTHLSGGLDSSTIACLASSYYGSGEPVHTFTGAFSEGKEFNETKYADIVAQDIGAITHLIEPTASDFLKLLPKIIFHMDEPAAGPGVFPQFMVSKLAAENVKVVLGGQGGDEIFSGYARYLVGYLEECLKGAIEQTSETAKYAATLSSIISSLPMLQQYIPLLRTFWQEGLFEPMEERYFRLMDRSAASKEIFNADVFTGHENVKTKFNEIFLGSDATSFLNRMLYFDLKVHLPALLHVEDRTSMSWGIESRVPLLDHRICEFIAHVPTTIKFKNGEPKYLFKKAIKNIIPDKILERKDKMGFPVPLQQWYRSELKEFVQDTLLGSRAVQRGIFNTVQLEKTIHKEQSFGRAVWGALCLEMWFQEFIDA